MPAFIIVKIAVSIAAMATEGKVYGVDYSPARATFVSDLREIERVLKPGAALLLIAETYKGERFEKLMAIPMHLLGARYLTVDEHRQAWIAAGFSDATVDVESRKGWICCVALRNAATSR